MESVKVRRFDVLEAIKANRTKHKEDYLLAIKAYRVKAADLLTKELKKIKEGKEFSVGNFSLHKPESHLKDYNLAIKMLEMSVEDIVELKLFEFNQLVNDDWNWKSSFKMSYMSNYAYSGSVGLQGSSGSAGTQGSAGSDYEWEILFPDSELDID